MPQKIIPILADAKYHIFNRGVDKRDIFLDKSDYLRFYQSLNLFNSEEAVVNFDFARVHTSMATVSPNRLVEIEAYSLLSNHFHLLLKSVIDGGASEFMRRISLGYTSYFNQKYERSGILFQGAFKRVYIESQEQYQYVFAYVNENHHVHDIQMDREVCHSSSLHYQGIARSKLITNFIADPYQLTDNILLAKNIAMQRKNIKQDKVFFD